MKKILLIIVLLIFSSPAYAGKIKNFSAFYDKDFNYNKELKVDNPKNKIIIVFNHG